MIEFCGEINGRCKKYRLHVESVVGLVSALIPAILLAIPVTFCTIIIDWIFILIYIPLVLFVILAAIVPLSKKTGKLILPYCVQIYDNRIESKGEKFHVIRMLSHVKKVVDMGDWYQIFFRFPYKNGCFVCQKNLIKQGSIPEFETKFKDVLIRNYKCD